MGQKVKVHWCPQFEPLPIELSVAWHVSSGWKSTRRSPRRTDPSSRMMDMPSPCRMGDGPFGGCWSLPESDGISSNTRFSPRRYKHVYVFQRDEHASFGARTWCLDKSVSTKEIILRFPLKTFLQMFLLNPFNKFCHHIKGWNTCSESRVYQFNNQSLQGLLRPSPDWRDSFRKFMLEFHQGMISKQHSGN